MNLAFPLSFCTYHRWPATLSGTWWQSEDTDPSHESLTTCSSITTGPATSASQQPINGPAPQETMMKMFPYMNSLLIRRRSVTTHMAGIIDKRAAGIERHSQTWILWLVECRQLCVQALSFPHIHVYMEATLYFVSRRYYNFTAHIWQYILECTASVTATAKACLSSSDPLLSFRQGMEPDTVTIQLYIG